MLWTRRSFLAAPAALALDGGTPVRATPLRARHFGPLYYDESEWTFLKEVWQTRSPFRFWNFENQLPDKVATLEREFAQKMGVQYALAVNSGTTALEAALAALEIGPGDEVIVPAWTWHSCFHAVVRHGALPVCAEIDESFNLDPARVEAAISPRTKVMMIVHLQGNPADMDRLLPVARKRGLKVLEDVSQAVGASYKGRRLGSMGDIAAASLQVNKTISAGEGGMVYTNDPLLFERAVRFHDVGTLRRVHEDWIGKASLEGVPGSNFRMTEFTGAVLLSQVRKLDRIVGDIRAVARRVYQGIADLPGLKTRLLPDPAGELGVGVYLDLGSREARDLFLKAMRAENVPAAPPSGSVVLPVQPYAEKKLTVHPDWPTYKAGRGPEIRYGAASCPRTIGVLDRFGGVLLDPKFGEADTRDIVAAIRKVYPQVTARASG
jgi:8-amino-3,8-dideoxy-alpha-D-manno-octulosonate transaminase